MTNEKLFLAELKREDYKPLSIEEERELLKKAVKGDNESKVKIIKSNLRFVYKMAQKFKRYADLMDLVQDGSLGMWKSFDNFQVEKLNPKQRFITYARLAIAQRMMNTVRTAGNITVKETSYFKNHGYKKIECLSLQSKLNHSEAKETKLEDILSTGENVEAEVLKKIELEKLKAVIAKLTEQDKDLIKKIYVEQLSLREISKQYGISFQAVHERKKKILYILRKHIDK